MNNENHTRQIVPKVNLNNFLILIITICSVTAIIVWTLPNSIAARNISLGLGGFFSLPLIFKSHYNKILSHRLISFYCLLALIVWLYAHYFFFPVSPEIQLDELKSTWLRVLGAILLGTGMGFAIAIKRQLQYFVFLSLFSILSLHIYLFLNVITTLKGLPNFDVNGIFISKAGGTYFLLWPFFVTCAYINFLLGIKQSFLVKTNLNIKLTISVCFLILSFVAFFRSEA